MTDLPQRRENDELVLQEARPRLKRPPLYRVLLLNDDYTPMEFVVGVLQKLFRLEHDKAVQIMMHVHQKGVGICGLFPREIAETRVEQVMALAQEQQHPLQCTMEPEHDDANEDAGGSTL
jgi:ATP-dependent Clp protease adaptor protein ClpS